MNPKQQLLIAWLGEGIPVEKCVETLTKEPHNVPMGDAEMWVRDPDLLQAGLERSNDLIIQCWGAMWRTIKEKAVLGSVQHSKMLIEFITNGKKLASNEMRLVFEKAVKGEKGEGVDAVPGVEDSGGAPLGPEDFDQGETTENGY